MNIIELKQLGRWIAEQLETGNGWKLNENLDSNWQIELMKPLAGTSYHLGITLEEDARAKRITAHVDYVDLFRYWRNEDAISKIGMSATKTPAQMARDIERRLLPGYERLFREALKRKEDRDAEIARRWLNAENVRAILHGKLTNNNGAEYPTAYAHGAGSSSFDFKTDYHSNFEVKLTDVPADIAKMIAEMVYTHLLKDLKPEEDE